MTLLDNFDKSALASSGKVGDARRKHLVPARYAFWEQRRRGGGGRQSMQFLLSSLYSGPREPFATDRVVEGKIPVSSENGATLWVPIATFTAILSERFGAEFVDALTKTAAGKVTLEDLMRYANETGLHGILLGPDPSGKMH